MAVTGPPASRPWWSRAAVRVGVLTGATALASAAVTLTYSHHALDPPALPGGFWWVVVLAVLFALTEGFAVYVRVRRSAHAISLSEFPMVLGLLAVTPFAVIVLRAGAGALGLFALRRQRGAKLAFNTALLAAQAAIAVLVFQAIAPNSLGATLDGLNPREWLATYAAVLSSDVVAAVLLTAVIAIHDDPGEWRRLPAALRSSWMVVVTTTIALVGYSAAVRSPWSLALVGLVAVVLFMAYRAYVALGNGNAEVEQLYAFTRALDRARELDDLVPVVLDRVRDTLRAGVSELATDDGDGRLQHTRLHGQSDTVTTELGWAADDAWLQPVRVGQPVLHPSGDAMAVPVQLGADRTAVLAVHASMPDAGPFTPARLKLFEALANHAGAALGRAELVDRLRREAAAKLHQSLHDPLTGLPNRRHFQQLLDESLAAGTQVAVMLLDLDRFKEINDALGHETGDALLREVGGRLAEHVSGDGVVARMGGDEYAVFLPLAGGAPAAVAAAAALGTVIERGIRVGPITLTARASIGVALAQRHGDDGQTLIRHADVAMYAAKDHRSGVRLYDPSVDVNSPERLALIADLRDAVERRDLTVMFQPKADPRTGRVTGAEALARWHHPVRGSIPPDEFIPLAEHSGLIRPLTLHVLEVSLRRRATWARDGHDLHVAVNVSPNVLLDGELPEIVARLLAQTGTPPHALTLEITEGTILADPAGSRVILERLHALGLKLSIDDFGTGYSSLGRLRELPIHEVKIDKSFVQGSATDHRDRAVVRSAVQLGHALDLEVVAEGVEDAETNSYLAQEGCDAVQGYWLSRPLPPDGFAQWLANYSSRVG